MDKPTDKPACFADLDRVMPFEAETGLRGPNQGCLKCPHLPECLRAAVSTPQGLKERHERLEQTCGRGGLRARLLMWHERKLLERQQKK